MAISDRLTKLTTDITNAYTSIENKGGTIPSDKNTNNLSTAIDSIEVIEEATAEGEDLTLTNTKAMPFVDIKIKGKTEQFTTTGKQLFNKNSLSPSNCTLVYNNGIYTATKTGSSPKIESNISLLAGNYTINSIGNLGTIIFYNGNTQVKSISSNHTYYNFTLESDVDNVKFWFSGDTYNFDFDTLMIASGTYTSSTMPDWEEYSGGSPAPNPSYPQEIINVEGRNKFNNSQTFVNAQYGTDGTYYDQQPSRVMTDFIPIEYAKKYTIYCDLDNDYDVSLMNYNFFDKDKTWIGNRITNGDDDFRGLKQKTFTVNVANTKYIRIVFRNYNSATDNLSISAVQNSKIQLEEGNATPYVPYNTIGVKVQNKNLFNKNNVHSENSSILEITSSGFTVTRTHNANYGDEFIASYTADGLKPNTVYTLSLDVESENTFANSSIYCYSDKLFGTALTKSNYEASGNNRKWNITTNSSGKIVIGFYGTTSTQNKIFKFTNIQLEESSTKTDYISHAEQNKYFTLEEGQELAEGDYLADDGIHKIIINYVFTGQEGFTYGAGQLITDYFKNLIKKPDSNGTVGNIKSNKYKPVAKWYSTTENSIAVDTGGNLYINNPSWSSLSDGEAGIIGTVIQYELAEENITPYTPQQEIQYLKIKAMQTYENITYTSTDGDLRPSTEVKYYKKK